MYGDLDKVLFEEEEIAARLDSLAAEITADYHGLDLTVIAILNGSLIFMADLLRRVPLPLQLDCLRVRSYSGMVSTGQVTFDPQTLPDLRDRHVLLLDDILDSGHTLTQVKPLSVRSCVLLRKLKQRARPVEADYVGFDIQDEFVVGYGLDYNEKYRNLSVIGVLRQE